MHRMSGIDASFLYLETPWLRAHTLKIAELEVPGTWTFERTRRAVARVLPHLPALTRRAVPVPMRLHHPVWVHDRDPELDWHVRHHVLPSPGDERAFEAFVSAFAAEPLDPERPLWQVYVVEGFASGRIAVVAKLHHALADGGAAASLLDTLSTPDPRGRLHLGPRPLRPEPSPSPRRLVRDAVVDRVASLGLLPGLAVDSVTRLGRWWRARRRVPEEPPLPFEAPFTSFNQPLTDRRVFARTSLPLTAVKQVKDAWDCTVNDVVLALVASAVRAYLVERGEPVDAPLVAAMPLSTADQPYLHGNQLSNTLVALPVHLADPVARLMAVARATRSVKQVHEHLGRDMMGRWLEFSGPKALRAYWTTIARRFAPPPINLVVSNVRGPSQQRWFGASAMTGLWSVGPVLERIGLNVTVWTYQDQVHATVLSCPRNVAAPHRIVDALGDALLELVQVAVPRERRTLQDVDGAPRIVAARAALKGETVQ